MDLLQNVLGGGQQRHEFQDFLKRYDQGPPYQGFSGEEAYQRYQQIAPQLPPEVFEDAARESFSRMSPQERQQFGHMLRQRSQQQGVNFPDLNQDGVDDRLQDPNYLAQVTGRMHQQQPGLLGQLLGGGQHGAGGGIGDLLNNPLAKAALGGIAAMALKRMMSGGFGSQGNQRGTNQGGVGGNNQGDFDGGNQGGFGGIPM